MKAKKVTIEITEEYWSKKVELSNGKVLEVERMIFKNGIYMAAKPGDIYEDLEEFCLGDLAEALEDDNLPGISKALRQD